MGRKRILDVICVISILLIIGIVGLVFYAIFAPDITNDDLLGEISLKEVNFDLNGADFIEEKSISCDNQKDCVITLPIATRKDGIVLGYDTSPVATNPKYHMNDKIKVGKSMVLYVISYTEKKITIDENNVDYLENENLSCKAFNKEKGCNVVLPKFNKIGYENRGYSSSDNSLTGFAFPNEKYKITKDMTLYPIYGINNHLVTLDIDDVLSYNDSIIEIENGCDEDVYKKYLEYVKEIDEKANFLLLGNKISFVSDDSFDDIWGTQYVGMNYGPNGARSLDIRCSNKIFNDYYGTMVHEMSHSWDFFYGMRTNKNLSEQNDIINLYNKYTVIPNRPFRDYSYSSIYEFLADAVKYYYFKYLVPTRGYKEIDYPEDIKVSIEKYICIAKNDYEEVGC